KPSARRLAGIDERADAPVGLAPTSSAIHVDQSRPGNREQIRTEARVATKTVTITYAGEQGLLHEILGQITARHLVAKEAIELVEMAPKQLAARSPVARAPLAQKLVVILGHGNANHVGFEVGKKVGRGKRGGSTVVGITS